MKRKYRNLRISLILALIIVLCGCQSGAVSSDAQTHTENRTLISDVTVDTEELIDTSSEPFIESEDDSYPIYGEGIAYLEGSLHYFPEDAWSLLISAIRTEEDLALLLEYIQSNEHLTQISVSNTPRSISFPFSGLDGLSLEYLCLTGFSDLGELSGLASLKQLAVGQMDGTVYGFEDLGDLGIKNLTLTSSFSGAGWTYCEEFFLDLEGISHLKELESLWVDDESLLAFEPLLDMEQPVDLYLHVSNVAGEDQDYAENYFSGYVVTWENPDRIWALELDTCLDLNALYSFVQKEGNRIYFGLRNV